MAQVSAIFKTGGVKVKPNGTVESFTAISGWVPKSPAPATSPTRGRPHIWVQNPFGLTTATRLWQ